ncbi:MAG: hypothetical protein A2096_08935 [Spirochaetes bacterium GWF1_41_5]|nr:MAG: hypothetical protein A2096_08935 [Spirochaetes bacterium GWF1_41_5]HBE01951.1 hypothetical protein [Spirochaetia bacterium]
MEKNLQNLEYYQSLVYPVIVKKVNNTFYFYINELGLFTETANIEAGYRQINEDKSKLFEKLFSMGFINNIRLPGSRDIIKPQTLDEIKLFLFKFISAIFVVSIFSGLFFLFLKSKIPSINKKAAAYAVQSANQTLEKFSNLSVEKKENLRLLLRRTAVNIKPLTDEMRILFP